MDDKAKFVFEVAEYVIMDWISYLIDKPLNSIFKGGSRMTKSLYIDAKDPDTNANMVYEIKPSIVPHDYELNLNGLNKQCLEAVGFIIYCIKTVYLSIIELLKEYVKNAENNDQSNDNYLLYKELINDIKLSMANNHTFYGTYIHPDLVKKDQLEVCINKLLKDASDNKKSDDWDINWAITTRQLELLNKDIENDNINKLCDERNIKLKTKKRIGIIINKINKPLNSKRS